MLLDLASTTNEPHQHCTATMIDSTDSESDGVGAGNSTSRNNDSEQNETENGENLGQREPEFSLSVVLDTQEIESADDCNNKIRSVLIESKRVANGLTGEEDGDPDGDIDVSSSWPLRGRGMGQKRKAAKSTTAKTHVVDDDSGGGDFGGQRDGVRVPVVPSKRESLQIKGSGRELESADPEKEDARERDQRIERRSE